MGKPKKNRKPAKLANRNQATVTQITSAPRRQRVLHMGPTGKCKLVWREAA